VKAASVSAELVVIQRAVEGACVLVELGRQGGLEDEDTGALVASVLTLAACRVRDLGRAVRGSMPVDLFVASHNEAVAGSDGKDFVLNATGTNAARGSKS
jgi:hypothetical protein